MQPIVPAPRSQTGPTPDARDAALDALAAGLSVVPPKEDGSKAPDGRWKEYQRSRATSTEIDAWYVTQGRPKRTGLGIVCGAVSGNLECLEFDAQGECYAPFRDAARALGLGDVVDRLEAGYLERSPSGGVHWFYRCDRVEGSAKLAMRYKDPSEFDDDDRKAVEKAAARGQVYRPVKTLVETRGEGGYIVVAPSHGRVHPTGKPYELLRGAFKSIATITADEREALWSVARSFDVTGDGTEDRAEVKAKGTHTRTAGTTC
jgi:putative DNA primase/helicase